MIVGRWSAFAGQSLGIMLHLRIGLSGVHFCHTLSGQVQLLLSAKRVGMPEWRAIIMSWSKRSSRRGWILSADEYRLVFMLGSHISWCLLKSPSHII